jgi:hypothetical protein
MPVVKVLFMENDYLRRFDYEEYLKPDFAKN